MPDDHYLLEHYLETATVLWSFAPSVQGGGGHPDKFGATLAGGITVFVKPAGTAPEGTRMVHNEVAAYETLKLLGWSDLTTTTVRRYFVSPITNSTTVAVAQVLLSDVEVAPSITSLQASDVTRAATFDYLIANSDRGGQTNYLGTKGVYATSTTQSVNHLILIDHGYAFDFPNQQPQSIFVNERKGQPLPNSVLERVELFVLLAPSSPLPELLGLDSFGMVVERAKDLLSIRRIE